MKSELALSLIIKRLCKWQAISKHQLPSQQEIERHNFIKLYELYKKIKKKEDVIINQQKKCPNDYGEDKELAQENDWISTGSSDLIINLQTIQLKDYFDYIRMDSSTYMEIFTLIEQKIKKEFLVKYPVPAHTRLQITLRYLASGENMSAIGQSFKVASNTVSKIVTETCEAIWEVMKKRVLPFPDEQFWLNKAQSFEELWEFPHCLGVIKQKQLVLQTPVGEKHENLVLFAVADALSCFSLIHMNIENVKNNRIDFSDSEFANNLEKNLNLPPPANELPFIFVGDETFNLQTNLLTPYPNSDAPNIYKQIFNQNMYQVLKCADHAFGILIERWHIFQKRLSTNLDNTKRIIHATMCLHNFLMHKELEKPLDQRQYSILTDEQISHEKIAGFQHLSCLKKNQTAEAESTRNLFQQLMFKNNLVVLDWT